MAARPAPTPIWIAIQNPVWPVTRHSTPAAASATPPIRCTASRRPASRCWFPANLLNRGTYVVGVTASTTRSGLLFGDQYALRFRVDISGGVGSQWRGDRNGFLRPALAWETEQRTGQERESIEAAEVGTVE